MKIWADGNNPANTIVFQALFEGAANPILIADAEGRYIAANRAALDFLECSEGLLVTKSVRDYSPKDFQEREKSLHSPVTGRLVLEADYLVHGTIKTLLLSIIPVQVSGHWFTIESGHDITRYKRAEKALQESDERFRLLIDGISDYGIYMLDRNGVITSWNAAAERLTGYHADEIIGKNFSVFFTKEDIGNGKPGNELQMALTKGRYEEEAWRVRKDGSLFIANIIITALYDKLEQFHGFVEVTRDITDRKMGDQSLAASEAKYRDVVETQTELICRFLSDGTYIFANEAYCRYINKNYTELIGKKFKPDIPTEDREKIRIHFASLTPVHPVSAIDHRIIMPDGTIRWQRWSDRAFFDEAGNIIEYQSVGRDITDRMVLEEEILKLNRTLEEKVLERTRQLNASLKEKEILLREIHHRVKNNLQIIISMLNLQARYLGDETTRTIIRESQNRIKAMAMVHEKMYQSRDISRIKLDEYFRFIVNNLLQFYGGEGRDISINVDCEDIRVDINAAIPLGLIVNELISNAFKHAFPGNQPGHILISVQEKKKIITICIQDNGSGMPESLDWRNPKSLGLRLVISLIEQLQGTIELVPMIVGGTYFVITVKEPGKGKV
jgi:PAS domain S-box-containing protein